MRIVSAEKKRGHLMAVALDDGQTADIDIAVWEHSRARTGDEIGEEAWENLRETSVRTRVHERALYYLSARDYGSGEMAGKLRAAGFPRDAAEREVRRLCDAGLIDDERTAGRIARDLASRKLYPRRRIVLALRDRGFSAETAERAAEALPDDEVQQALALLRRKRYNGNMDFSDRQKALGALARYGFSYGAAKEAIERLGEDESSQ